MEKIVYFLKYPIQSTKFFLAEMFSYIMHHLIIIIKINSLKEIFSIIWLPRLRHIFLNGKVENRD
jgi:hypothetical protein